MYQLWERFRVEFISVTQFFGVLRPLVVSSTIWPKAAPLATAAPTDSRVLRTTDTGCDVSSLSEGATNRLLNVRTQEGVWASAACRAPQWPLLYRYPPGCLCSADRQTLITCSGERRTTARQQWGGWFHVLTQQCERDVTE
eukprot:Selendium_serpulae@DN4080_c0_g1_i2.p1